MNANSIHVKRTRTVLKPDQSRVLLRPFSPGDSQRVGGIIARIMSIPEEQVGPLLDEISAEFCQRHLQIDKIFQERFEQVREMLFTDAEVSHQRRLLIYTCGALLHKGELVIPYGLADHATGFATAPVDDVLAAMHSKDD